MRTEKDIKSGRRKKTGTRILELLLALLIVLILLTFFLVPVYVSSEKGRKTILARINSSIDGELDFASLSMSWWKGIKVAEISFNDSAGQTLVEIKQIVTKPRYSSILIGGLSFGETIIDEPKIEISLKGGPAEKPESSRQKASSDGKSQVVGLPIKKISLVINDGNLKVADARTETVEVTGIKSKMTIDFPGRYPAGQTHKLLANLSTNIKLGFEKARYLGFNFGPTEVDVQIQKGLMKIAPFSTTVNNGRINFAGEADFNHKVVLLRTPGQIQIAKDVQISDETTQKLLMYLNPVFANAVNVRGVVNFSCERLAIPLAGADKNDTEVVGTVSLNKLRLQASDLLGQILSMAGTGVRGQDITIHPTRFVLQEGFLRYEDMQMDIGDNPVNFKGVIGLDKSLNMMVTLPYTTKGRTARVGEDTTGKRITLKLKGTVDRPELDLGDLVDREFGDQLKQELGDKLKEELGDELGEKALEALEELFK